MPMTTFLHDAELNRPTGDADLDEYLAQARQKTGRDYQVVKHRAVERFGPLGLRSRIVERTQLYLYVGGMGPWQVLQCAHDLPTIRAFLLGLLNGTPSAGEGIALITAERQRQVSVEGWTPEHDDEHENGELASAAMAYAWGAPMYAGVRLWPWEANWWKPGDRIREIAKAGALLAAEIDRLKRAAFAPGTQE
jgi:hypothetical protein